MQLSATTVIFLKTHTIRTRTLRDAAYCVVISQVDPASFRCFLPAPPPGAQQDIFAAAVSLITGRIVYISDQAASILDCKQEVFHSAKLVEFLSPQDVGVFYSFTTPYRLPSWSMCTGAGRHTCIHRCTHTRMHAHSHTHTFTHMYTYPYKHTRTHTHTHTHKSFIVFIMYSNLFVISEIIPIEFAK